MEAGATPNFVDAVLVERLVAPTVPAHHPISSHALCEVFVGRAEHDLLDARFILELRGCRRQRIVRFELHHRPDQEPERGGRALGERELREERFVDAGAGLVAVEELIAKALDDGVERDADVRHPLRADQGEQAPQERARGADLPPSGVGGRGGAEEHPEELVGAVDEVDLHRSPGGVTTAVFSSCSGSTSRSGSPAGGFSSISISASLSKISVFISCTSSPAPGATVEGSGLKRL